MINPSSRPCGAVCSIPSSPSRLQAAKRSVLLLGLATVAAVALLPTAQAQIVKWHPGHYARVQGDNISPTVIGPLIDHPGITGYVVRMRWVDLETSQGVYNMAHISNYLNHPDLQGKQLIIELRERDFPDGTTNSAVPAYLNVYNVTAANGKTFPDYRIPAFIDRYVALLTAIANAFDTHPNFEGIESSEQAPFGLGDTDWENNLIDLADRGKDVLKHTLFWAPITPAMTNDSGKWGPILNTHKAGLYLIDTPPHEFDNGGDGDGWAQLAGDNPHAFPVKATGQIGAWEVSEGDFDDPEYYYDVAKDILYAHHIGWTTIDATWWGEVTTFLNNGGSPLPANTQVPASIAGLQSPLAFTPTVVSSTRIDLTWTDDSVMEDGFRLEYDDNSSFTSPDVVWPGENHQSKSISGLTSGTTYYFRLRSYNDAYNSSWVTASAATPPSVVTQTFYSASAEDGDIREAGENSSTGGTIAAGNTTLRTGDDNTDQQFRTILSFDTSSLPDNAVVVSATLRLRRSAVTGTSPFGTHGTCQADIKTYNFNSNVALESVDFQASSNGNNVAQMSHAASNGAWSEGEVASTSLDEVNLQGRTQFRVYFATGDNDDNSADFVSWHSGEAGAGNAPELIIQYQ